MNSIINIFHIALYKPLLNGLIVLTAFVPGHDLGIAVIILTLIVRALLLPFTHRATASQIALKILEPEIRKIKTQTKNEAERGKLIMELYRAHGVNPFSGCSMIIIQLPVLFALYFVFVRGINFSPEDVYSFVTVSDAIRTKFLGLWELAQPSTFWAIAAGAAQFFQARFSYAMTGQPAQKEGSDFSKEFSRVFAKQALYVLPIFIFIVSLRLPAAVALYWTTITFFAIVHDAWIKKRAQKIQTPQT